MSITEVKLRIAFENDGSTSAIDFKTSLSRTLHEFQKEGYAKVFQRDGNLGLLRNLEDYTHVILPKDMPVNDEFAFKTDFEPQNSHPIKPWKETQLKEFLPLNINETRILFATK